MGECFFWYRPTGVDPDQRPVNSCVSVCVFRGHTRTCSSLPTVNKVNILNDTRKWPVMWSLAVNTAAVLLLQPNNVQILKEKYPQHFFTIRLQHRDGLHNTSFQHTLRARSIRMRRWAIRESTSDSSLRI